GKELFAGISISNGKTLFPDDFTKNLIIAHYLLLPGRGKAEHKQGLDFAIKAAEAYPSQASMGKVIFAARYGELRPRAIEFCIKYFNDFIENKNLYAKQHAYHHRIAAALNVASYLQRIAQSQKKSELVQFYSDKTKEYNNERKELLNGKRW
ncbi:unnamed protein product, partial [marine sediment metagenome]